MLLKFCYPERTKGALLFATKSLHIALQFIVCLETLKKIVETNIQNLENVCKSS